MNATRCAAERRCK